jgi:hypothetical protein
LIAGLESGFLNLLAVNESSVDAALVRHVPCAVCAVQLGVPARHFRVVQAKAAAGVPAKREDTVGQLELLTFVGTFDN